MFTIPSMWNIIISTIVFVIAAWYFHRLLDEHMPKGMTRSLLVFVLAYVVSWTSGELVDWSREKLYGPEPVSETQKNLNDALDVLKASGITTH